MKWRWLVIWPLAALSACDHTNSRAEDEKKAWAYCLFELDKIEAIRGRNLDDLDKGNAVARNQFMMDCLWTKNAAPSLEHISDMGDYKGGAQSRSSHDISLNNGKR